MLYVYLGAIGNQASGGDSGSLWKNIFLGVGLVATIIVTVLITKKAKAKLNEKTASDLESDDEES